MVRVLSGVADLLSAAGDDPLTRSGLVYVHREVHGWSVGSDVVWRGVRADGRPTVFGTGAGLPTLLAQVADELPAEASFSFPADVDPPPRFLVTRRGEWQLRWVRSLPPVPGEAAASVLDPAEDADVVALLDRAYPDADTYPGQPAAAGWMGIRDEHGTLVACAADTSSHLTGRISAVTTDPRVRRTGLGGAVTAALTHRLFGAVDMVVLGIYLTNQTAIRMYERIGYRDAMAVTSGRWAAN